MNLNITIDEEKLTELVTEQLVKDIRYDAFNKGYGMRMWHDVVKTTIREILQDEKDNIVDYAVKYAGEYIGRKGVAKFLEEFKK